MNKISQTNSRRNFLKSVSFAAVAFPFVPLGISSFVSCAKSNASIHEGNDELKMILANANRERDCTWCGARDVPEDLSWKTAIADKNDEGEPLIISGKIYLPDGKTLAPSMLFYGYHTNAKGIYQTKPEEHRHGKFRGWMLTDEAGRFEFRTIKPASYPNTRVPPHIHISATGKNYPERNLGTIEFLNDSHVTEEMKAQAARDGMFAQIIELKKDEKGFWRGVCNLKLR